MTGPRQYPQRTVVATARLGLEGVVVKERGAPYRPGRRSRAWIKIKHTTTGRFVSRSAHSNKRVPTSRTSKAGWRIQARDAGRSRRRSRTTYPRPSLRIPSSRDSRRAKMTRTP